MTTLASTVLATVVVLAARASSSASGWGAAGRADARAPAGPRRRPDHAGRSSTWCRSSRCSAPAGSPRSSPAVVFAAPVAIKIVADGIRGVPADDGRGGDRARVDPAGRSITKVQLPMARRALAARRQPGPVYVLSMVVVGGLVGAGALGYDVVAGFSQGELYGKGLAAGLAIVLLGVMLDRITQAAARRAGPRDRPDVTPAPAPRDRAETGGAP